MQFVILAAANSSSWWSINSNCITKALFLLMLVRYRMLAILFHQGAVVTAVWQSTTLTLLTHHAA